MFGHTAYIYCLVVLFIMFMLARRIVNSPFGLSLKAIKGNPLRSAAVGIAVNWRLVAVYTLSAAYAGVAGALLAQTQAFASLSMLSLERSADVLLILIIGGTGYLYGGIFGALIYRLLQDYLSDLTARYWQFWIGLLLVAIVLIGRERIGGWIAPVVRFASQLGRRQHPQRRPRSRDRRKAADMAPVLETRSLDKRFGGIIAANAISLAIEKGARHALIGPNGAGKTTFVNLLTGMLQPSGGEILLDGAPITYLAPHKRVRLGIARTFQINQLFADLTPIETLGLAISERHGSGRDWWRIVGTRHGVTEEIGDLSSASASPTS